MIRIDAAWLATAPLDIRAGTNTDTALYRVIAVFGDDHPHHAALFANYALSFSTSPRLCGGASSYLIASS